MLKGTKYEDTKLLGCVVVLLKESGDYVEYKVPQDVVNIIMGMNMKDYLKK
jgi:hemolysin-activating ACP:hemolysin acyltransferase